MMLLYWWGAVVLDWYSTVIAHDYRVEENPFMRYWWQHYGDIGFTVVSILFGVIYTLVYHYGYRYTRMAIIPLAMFLMVSFKILIGLTNLAIIPYWVTGWWQF